MCTVITGLNSRDSTVGEHVIENPKDAGEKRVSEDGRLWLGKEYQGKMVEYAVKILDEDEIEEQ